jgi:hypothetical protein
MECVYVCMYVCMFEYVPINLHLWNQSQTVVFHKMCLHLHSRSVWKVSEIFMAT